MTAQKRPYDLFAVQSATQRANDWRESAIRRGREMESDACKEARQLALRCRHCFYLSGLRVAGQAFTEWECARCGEERTHPNTAVPALCDTCAKETGLCVTCMGDREGRVRRKLP